MGRLDFDSTLTDLLTRATFGVAGAERLPFIQHTIDWARNNLAICLLDFITFAIGTAMILLSLDSTLALCLAGSTFLGTLAPSGPLTPLAINRAGINIAFCKLHQRSITDLAVI
jgi:hypothetical protein